jgi:hypothetical protein
MGLGNFTFFFGQQEYIFIRMQKKKKQYQYSLF